MSIKVLIADDIDTFRTHFKNLLSKETDITVVGTAKNATEAIRLSNDLQPDVALLDIQMETETAGILATREILKCSNNTKIIMFTIHDDNETIIQSYEAGAVDYILKTASSSEVLTAIRDAVRSNDTHRKISNIVKDEMLRLRKERESFLFCVNLISRLSITELEILKLLCEGKKYREIADIRFVSESTVRVMVNKITKKFENENIRDVIKQINQNGILSLLQDISR